MNITRKSKKPIPKPKEKVSWEGCVTYIENVPWYMADNNNTRNWVLVTNYVNNGNIYYDIMRRDQE